MTISAQTFPAGRRIRAMSMDQQAPPPAGPDFKILFIGAGGINFGSPEGPWDHSFRLEHKLGPRLKAVGIVDPNAEARRRVLAKKRASFVEQAYALTREYDDLSEFLHDLKINPSVRPHAVILGAPPHIRGSLKDGRNIEDLLSANLPGVGIFVEKPVASGTVEEVMEVASLLKDRDVICSVAYMFRYLAVIQFMKTFLESKSATVSLVSARYCSAYSSIAKQHWWDKSLSGGPVVEQGTHWADLCRYFGGDVDLDSVQAHTVEWNSPAGKLAAVPFDEAVIPEENRISRVTTANWKFASGAVGTFTHSILLQGTKYDTLFEVYADGYQLRLVDAYDEPTVYVRSPESDGEEKYTFHGDDPYFGEISAFIDAVDGNKKVEASGIHSSFLDACKTYELTWAIRLASEKNH